MNNRHPWQLQKSKFCGPFWSYQLDSNANSAYSSQKWAKWAELAVLFSWQLQNGPLNFDFFSIATGADYSFELISIVHWVPQFFMHNKSILGVVRRQPQLVRVTSYCFMVCILWIIFFGMVDHLGTLTSLGKDCHLKRFYIFFKQTLCKIKRKEPTVHFF